jgi:mannose-6-phosphate isomerase
MVESRGHWQSLDEVIEAHPDDILGKDVAAKYHRRLPYLFKVLAAVRPLSIQAHPSLAQARAGFARENRLGIPLDAPNRNYRDDNHKPEMICALTDFWALCGFRPIRDIITRLEKTCHQTLESELEALRGSQNEEGLKAFFRALMTMDARRKAEIISQAGESSSQFSEEDGAFEWVARLLKEFPEDMGILSPLLMNLVCLKPGEAMFLGAGVFHAYLNGVGMELMANSDNVLRGGLTSKHTDVEELLQILDFTETGIEILTGEEVVQGERIYASPADEFILSVIAPKDGAPYLSQPNRSVEIILCTEGKATIIDREHNEVTVLFRGTSVVVPAAVKAYEIQGEAVLYKASVP